MGKTMLIDAAHQEETRVVVLDQNNQIEEFDYENASKRQLKGNIYLAKVTRVEPSLQAAFVEYGGNRHGFLAFSEIHPDYYQIPVSDREALLEIAAEERRESERLEAQDGEEPQENEEPKPSVAEEDPSVWNSAAERSGQPATCEDDSIWTSALERSVEKGDLAEAFVEDGSDEEDTSGRNEGRPRKRRYAKRYKIQEVIKRRQVMLIQIVKEERGNKGAAVTSYLSLAGRYGVLMPNTNRGGGISRKIANVSDRKRLRSAVADLNVPEGMGLIIRTAGAQRTKSEIKRDYDYLLRLWENVRELTLKSSAPTLVYEEGSLIKRSIRDLYNKDISSVIVEGDGGYKEAKAFMRMLIPSHAKNVQPYKNPTPLYHRYKVESHLEEMFNPVVQLKSGGYLVINPTEALISIDVNSGRATREHSIEETALKTNIEAAEEAARQFRLRDLAGLVVIDFIDMEEHRNNRAVERTLKEALKPDRARIQVGRISMFGLLEMSRQRMRAGLHESGTVTCPHCEGVGRVRSLETIVLNTIRMIEEEGMKARTATAALRVPTDVGLYLLNQKRAELVRIEDHYSLHVDVELDHVMGPQENEFTRGLGLSKIQSEAVETAIRFDGDYEETDEDGDSSSETEAEAPTVADIDSEAPVASATEERPKRRRRRRKPSSADENGKADPEGTDVTAASGEDGSQDSSQTTDDTTSETSSEASEETSVEIGEDGEERKPRRRRRGRRGGRRNRRRTEGEEGSDEIEGSGESAAEPDTAETQDAGEQPEPIVEAEPKSEPEPERVEASGDVLVEERPKEQAETKVVAEVSPEPASEEVDEKVDAEAGAEDSADDGEPKNKRRGWWQRSS